MFREKNINFHLLIKKIIYSNKAGFIVEMLGWFNIYKSINVKKITNRFGKKKKSQMDISTDVEKAFGKKSKILN